MQSGRVKSGHVQSGHVPIVCEPTSASWIGRATVSPVSLDLRGQDPDAARFNALTQAVLLCLVGGAVALVANGLLFGTADPSRWLVVAVGAAAGAVPLVRWHLDRRRSDHLDLFGIERSLRPLLVRAAVSIDAVEEAGHAAPDGPIRDQLRENHRTALRHLRLMEADARQSGSASRQGLLQLCQQIDDLAAASQRLSAAAVSALPSVLSAHTERTILLEQTLLEQLRLEDSRVHERKVDERRVD